MNAVMNDRRPDRMKLVAVAALTVAAALAPGVPATAAAPAGRYTIGAATVYDTKTKLTWQRATPTTTYTWFAARDYCTSPAVATALGGTGWRLAAKKELLTLVDFSVALPGPTIDATAFPGTQATAYWAYTPDSQSANTAWGVTFDSGAAIEYSLGDPHYVRCVR